MKFRKYDILLVTTILLVSLGLFLFGKFTQKTEGLVAEIRVENQLVQTIDLYTLTEEPIFIPITGFLGETIYIVAKKNAIKVEEVNCDLQICAAHGFVNSTIRPIVCLPNRIVITLIGGHTDDATSPDLDGIV